VSSKDVFVAMTERFAGVVARFEPVRDDAGEIVRWYGTSTDIDALKQAEEKLREDERALRRITDAIPQQIVILEPDGRPIYANQATLDYTGLTMADVARADFRARIFHADDQRVRNQRQAALAAGVPFEFELRGLSKQRQDRWFLIRYKPFHDEHGRLVSWYATGMDIDERKRAEERIRERERSRHVRDAPRRDQRRPAGVLQGVTEGTMPEQKPNERATHGDSMPGLSRRSFLATTGTAGIVSAIDAGDVMGQTPPANPPDMSNRPGTVSVRLRINGKEHRVSVDPRTTLLDCLRETVALTGTKKGCDHGQCGACTVHVNDRRVNSCLSLAVMHDGDAITTIEGLGTPDALHPMQAAFVALDAYQCGYCTSGQIMSAVALLKEPCGPDDADVKELMSGNICRCGAYQNIVAAIQQVRRTA
jgi:xanthine dehydrogenase YagT iron-sulfur-binding subunit